MQLKYFFTVLLVFCLGRLQAQIDTSKFVYKKPLFDFNYGKPVFKLDSQQRANTTRQLRFSVFTGYREGVEPVKRQFGFNMATYVDDNQGTIRQSIYNASIVELISRGMPRPLNNQIILEVKDPSKYQYLSVYGDKQKWLRANAWCYELVMPRAAYSVKAIKTVDQDVAEYFGIWFGYEQRKVKAIVLVRISTVDKIKSDGKGKTSNGENGVFKNTGIDWLAMRMNIAGLPPFVNESNYPDIIDMDLGPVDYSDVNAVRRALHKYDLDLKEEIRDLRMFVIKENKQKNLVKNEN